MYYNPLTVYDFLEILRTGDINLLIDNTPCGTKFSDIIRECLPIAQGEELDGIAKIMEMPREYYPGEEEHRETDVSLRLRLNGPINFMLTGMELDALIFEEKLLETAGLSEFFPKSLSDDSLDALKYSLATGSFKYSDDHSYSWDIAAQGPKKSEQFPATCFHIWTTYEGLLEKYDYCTHCNEKR